VLGTIEEWFLTRARRTWFSGRSESPYEALPLLEADPGVTALAGQVLRLDGLPLPGVLVSSEDTRALTDRDGRFLLEDLPAGRSVITVDARTANRRGATYGIYEMGVELEKGTTTELPYTIWSPKLDTAHEIELRYPLEEDVVLTNPLIPGLEVHIRLLRRFTTARNSSADSASPRFRSTALPNAAASRYFTIRPAPPTFTHGVRSFTQQDARPPRDASSSPTTRSRKTGTVRRAITPMGNRCGSTQAAPNELTSAGIGTSQDPVAVYGPSKVTCQRRHRHCSPTHRHRGAGDTRPHHPRHTSNDTESREFGRNQDDLLILHSTTSQP
jgi:hypothetical protein